MPKITPNLWFDGNAEEAAQFYVSLLPDSRIENVWRSPADNPSTPAGAVLLVDFTVCEDQAEVDRLWDALTADGGEPGRCGWLKDRFGMSWQVVPRELGELLGSPQREGAGRAMEAMLRMDKIDVGELRRAFAG